MQRAFVQLLYTVIASDCVPALNGTPGLLDHVLEAAARLALSSDQTAQKVALSSLSKISLIVPAWSARTLRVALEIPSLPHITPSDAGSTLVVHEVCTTLSSLHQLDPDGFSAALRELVPNEFSEQLLSALNTLKGKNLDKQVSSDRVCQRHLFFPGDESLRLLTQSKCPLIKPIIPFPVPSLTVILSSPRFHSMSLLDTFVFRLFLVIALLFSAGFPHSLVVNLILFPSRISPR